MATLLETLAAPAKRPAVVADCERLIDEEVASKGGLTGFAIKAAYKMVKGFKPGFVHNVADGMLDDFCRNLQPLIDEARAQNRPIKTFFDGQRGRVADALLAATDARAQRSRLAAIKAAYEKLRGTAKKQVEEAVPRLGALVERHTG
jgi:hypothetical protein